MGAGFCLLIAKFLFSPFFSPDEIEKRERQRRQRKLNRQLEKKQAKLAAKGIHIDIGKEKMP